MSRPARIFTILIGSSGDAETQAVQDAADAWGEETGNTVEVIPANDLAQQLGQGFAGNEAPDLFYMAWDQFQTYASQGFLEPYAENLANADEFLPALREQFTFDDQFTARRRTSRPSDCRSTPTRGRRPA